MAVFKRGEGLGTTRESSTWPPPATIASTPTTPAVSASRSSTTGWPPAPPLLRVDQLTASRGGEVFVCEDIATDEIDIGVIDRRGRVSRFCRLPGLSIKAPS